MKVKIDAGGLQEMVSTLKRTCPKSAHDATMLKASGTDLLGVCIGDGLYAEYVADAEVEEPGQVIIGNAPLAAINSWGGDVHLTTTQSGKTLKVTGTHELNIRSKEVMVELFDRPTGDFNWLIAPPGLRKILYAAGAKEIGRSFVWLIDNDFVCGDGFVGAVALDWDFHIEEPVAIRAQHVEKSLLDEDSRMYLGDRAWFNSGRLTTTSPYEAMPKPPTQFLTMLGLEHEIQERAWFRCCKAALVNALNTLAVFATLSGSTKEMMNLWLSDGTVRLKPRGNEYGTGEAEVPVLESDGEIDLGLEATNFKDALATHDDKDVTLKRIAVIVGDTESPGWLIEGSHSVRHFISPVVFHE